MSLLQLTSRFRESGLALDWLRQLVIDLQTYREGLVYQIALLEKEKYSKESLDEESLALRRGYWSSSDSVEIKATGKTDDEREDVEEQETCKASQQKLSQFLDADCQEETKMKANKLEDGEHGTDVSFNYTDKFKSILEEMPAKEEGLSSSQSRIDVVEQLQSMILQLRSVLLRPDESTLPHGQWHPRFLEASHHCIPDSSLTDTNNGQNPLQDPLQDIPHQSPATTNSQLASHQRRQLRRSLSV